MRLEREGAEGLAVVFDDGARTIVPGARVRTYEDAMPDGSGDRAYWSEVTLHAVGDDLVLHVVWITDHEGGTSHRTDAVLRSADRGRTWTKEPDDAPLSGAPVLARLSTHWSDLEVVAGHRLIRRIGRGGLGDLYEATAPNGERVALRQLIGSDDDGIRARLAEIAGPLTSLRHPNVVAARLVTTDPLLLASNLVEGRTLAQALVSERLPLERTRRIACEILAGLEAIHASGLVHGDVRPANVILARDGAMLADGGLLVTMEEPRGTRGTLRTEFAYLAPEALPGRRPAPLADVYSAGACLYEMLAGKRAFAADSSIALAYAIVKQPPPALSPGPLAAVALRAMAKDAAGRFPSARAMQEALES